MSLLLTLLYNLLFVPIMLMLLPGYLLRIIRRGGYRHKALQRLGILDPETKARVGVGRIWIHAVSVGEVGIALKFAHAFRNRHPEARFLISSTTSTGLAILERSATDWLEPMANPVDFPLLTSRLMRRLRPAVLLFVESDLWLNRIHAAKTSGIPVALINARLSPRSERRLNILRPFAEALFNQLDLITLSDEEDRSRFLGLGVRPDILKLAGNIKHDLPSDPVRYGENGRDLLLLGASTHEGEEAILAAAWLELRNSYPQLKLAIAPRHVERRDEILRRMRELGIGMVLRSKGNDLSESPLLLDTTGELAAWYPKASVVFVGKSLSSSVHHGGQNMIEPLQAGTSTIVGPHTENFEPLASQLCRAGALIRVNDHRAIVSAVRSLLESEAARETMITAAGDVLRRHQGSVERNCLLLEELMASRSSRSAP